MNAVIKFQILIFLLLLTAASASLFAQQKMDSVRSIPEQVRKLENFPTTKTLKTILTRYNRKLDSIKGKLTLKIDSLQKLNLSTSHFSHLLDSIQHAGPLNDIRQAEAKLVSLEQRINQPLANINSTIMKVESKINEKIKFINGQTDT